MTARAWEGEYIKSIVYGGLDGTITTFAVVSGVTGAALNPGIALILGFANLVADGISMAAGEYLSSRAQAEYKNTEKEIWSQDHHKLRQLHHFYAQQGLNKEDSASLARLMVKYDGLVTDINQHEISPIKSSLITFFSFALFGLVPLFSYILEVFFPMHKTMLFIIACVLTALTLSTLGIIRGLITKTNPVKSGTETLLIGGLAAVAAYLIGALLAGLA